MINISIVVLSHNREDDLRANLPPLLAELLPEMELIVVDNASTDGSREFLQELQVRYPLLRTILLDQNLGPPGGRNAGFRVARGEYVVALDDDAFMNVNDIKKVPNYFYLYQNAGLLAFRVIHAKTGEKQNDHGDKVVAVANFHGAAHAIRKNLFNIVGYSDEDCKFGAEEFDFSVRCHAAGYQTIYLPDVQALHNSFPRSGRLGVFRREKWTYGYIRVIFKHFPTRMAYLYSFRYIILNFIWNRKFIDLQFVVSVLRSAFLGRRHGKMAREPLPAETVKFYSDPTLFPQFGNVPFNVMGRLKKKLLKW